MYAIRKRVKICPMLTLSRRSPVIIIFIGIFLTACQSTATSQPDSATITATAPATQKPTQANKSTLTPSVTLVPTDTPDEVDQNCCADYHIGLLGAPTTFNYWRYLGEDNSRWTGYVIGDEAPSLYDYPDLRSAQRLDFVPALAVDLPPKAEVRDEFWVIPVKMLDTATWSDDEPITAHDIVFTIQAVFDLQLGGRWADYYPKDSLATVKAKNDHTVEFYFNAEPGLSQWQFAVAMGPILPQHYWEEHVDEARTQIQDVEPPATCAGQLDLPQVSACQAYASARQILYEIEPLSPPSGGGYTTAGNTSGSTIRRQVNPNFYLAGVKISEYADGTWVRIFPDGTSLQLYGQAENDPILSYRRGPYSKAIKFTIYNSRIVAYDALSKGRVDYVLNPYNLTDDWLRQSAQEDEHDHYNSPQNGLAYLTFNMRRQPFDRPEFRQAVEILIDREQIAQKDLEGLVFPAYSIVPAANSFWRNPSLGPAQEGLSPRDRLDLAVQILKDAGWSWKSEPAWDAASRQIIPGDELRLPGGSPMPETNFIYPAPDEDLMMAAFGQEIADRLIALGVPLVPESLERAAIINRALVAGGSFDLYILDWRLPLYPGYLCELFYSENDTLLTGGYNSTGYNNPAFDELCDLFGVEIDPQLAQAQAYQMQSLLAEDLPYIPLFYPQVFDIIHSDVIFPYLPGLGGIVDASGFQIDARVLIK